MVLCISSDFTERNLNYCELYLWSLLGEDGLYTVYPVYKRLIPKGSNKIDFFKFGTLMRATPKT